jgi:hypothetical protein
VMTGLAKIIYTDISDMDWNDQGTLVEDVRCLQSTPEVADLIWLYFLAYRMELIVHNICLDL